MVVGNDVSIFANEYTTTGSPLFRNNRRTKARPEKLVEEIVNIVVVTTVAGKIIGYFPGRNFCFNVYYRGYSRICGFSEINSVSWKPGLSIINPA